MLSLSCHCGDVRIETAKRPDFVNACNCGFCSKAGVWWGYFHASEVVVEGATSVYLRRDKDEPAAEMRFCATCGALTHFALTPDAAVRFGNGVMGVNMRLASESDLAGIELRFPDGQAWPGHGDYGFVRPARILGQGVEG